MKCLQALILRLQFCREFNYNIQIYNNLLSKATDIVGWAIVTIELIARTIYFNTTYVLYSW